ncbi:MAG: shikimate kinase [Planctomycetota bacterium]
MIARREDQDDAPAIGHVLLIGLRGSGKSNVGRLLAESVGRAFVDLDDVSLELSDQRSIRDIFNEGGERVFRALEARALERVLPGDASIIALGGGTPTGDRARTLIERAHRERDARIVYLRCEVDELRRRLAPTIDQDDARPSLTGTSALDEIESVFLARDPLYLAMADHVVEGSASARDSAEAIAWTLFRR